MDKNPDPVRAPRPPGGGPGIVLCGDALLKAAFVDGLAGSAGCPVIVVDTDLLYSGYLGSGMIRRDGVEVVRPAAGDWRGALSAVAARASEERVLVIVDTLNGAYGMSGDPWHAMRVNSCVMLAAAAGRGAGSSVVVAAMARRREDGAWVLSPGGRQVAGLRGSGMFLLEDSGGGPALAGLDAAGSRIRGETPL